MKVNHDEFEFTSAFRVFVDGREITDGTWQIDGSVYSRIFELLWAV